MEHVDINVNRVVIIFSVNLYKLLIPKDIYLFWNNFSAYFRYKKPGGRTDVCTAAGLLHCLFNE